MSSDKRVRDGHSQQRAGRNVNNTAEPKTPPTGSRTNGTSTTTNSTSSTSSTSSTKTTPKATPPPTVKLSLFDLDIASEPTPAPSTPIAPTPPNPTKASPTHVPMVTLSLTDLTEQVDTVNQTTILTEELHVLLLDKDIVPHSTNDNKHASESDEVEEWEKWEDETPVIPIASSPSSTSTISTTKPRVRGRGGSRFNGEEESELGHMDTPEDSAPQPPSNNTRSSNKDHILEVYNIPAAYKTTDLENIFDKYSNLVRFKWVNDTSALAIFRTALFARDVLESITHPTVKLRPLSEAPEEARNTAQATPSLPTTTVARPYKTTTTVARRLIANALQMPELTAGRTAEDDVRDARRRVWDE